MVDDKAYPPPCLDSGCVCQFLRIIVRKPVKVAPVPIVGRLGLMFFFQNLPPSGFWPSSSWPLLGTFFELWLSRKRFLKAMGHAAMTLMGASTWTQKQIHIWRFSVPVTRADTPRTSAIANMKRLKQRTTAMLSFRRKSKDAVRSTITGIEITKKAHQRDLHGEFTSLRIKSVTMSNTTKQSRMPCSRPRNAGLELQSTARALVSAFL